MHGRKIVAALFASTLALTSAACGGGGDDEGSGGTDTQNSAGNLVIWIDALRAPAIKASADKFGAENNVTVKTEIVSENLQTAFVTASQAGKGPDIVLGAHDWIGNLVQNGAIDPIQMSDQAKAAFDPLAVKAVTFNGQVYGLPFTVTNVVLFRNTDLVPEAPKTIEELVATGKQLKDAGKVEEILSLPVGQNGDFYHIYPLYSSAGGYMFGQNAAGDYDPKDLGLAKPEAAAAFEKIGALGEKGAGALKRSVSTDNVATLFTEKKAAFMISGPWQLNAVQQSGVKYDLTPVPQFQGGQPAKPFVTVDAAYVASKGANKTLAQEFITNYFAQTETAVALFDADPRPPALIAAFDQVKGTSPDMAKVLEAGQAGQIMPAIPAMATVWDPLGKAEAAIIGGAPARSTIAAAAQTIQSQIK